MNRDPSEVDRRRAFRSRNPVLPLFRMPARCAGGRRQVLLCAALIMAALAGCGPVMETALRAPQYSSNDRATTGRISVLLDVSALERTSDTIDPELLRRTVEEELQASGLFREYRVAISAVPAAGGPESVDVGITRLDYVKSMTQFPPGPPLGCVILYPLVSPLLFERNYLRLEVTVLADLTVHPGEGGEARHSFLAESATGRTNFFGSGADKAGRDLQDIALRNFSRRIVEEFLALTR